jgi:1-phosphatidylinositol-3-phosphate 5-kinase
MSIETISVSETSMFKISSDYDCANEHGKNINCDNNDNRLEKFKINNRDKLLIDEKRVHCKSVSDKSDPLHQYMNEDEDDVFNRISSSSQYLNVADIPLLNKFKKALEGTILSVSPYMKFSIPYLETEPGRNCVLRSFFPKELYYSAYFSDKIEG